MPSKCEEITEDYYADWAVQSCVFNATDIALGSTLTALVTDVEGTAYVVAFNALYERAVASTEGSEEATERSTDAAGFLVWAGA